MGSHDILLHCPRVKQLEKVFLVLSPAKLSSSPLISVPGTEWALEGAFLDDQMVLCSQPIQLAYSLPCASQMARSELLTL